MKDAATPIASAEGKRRQGSDGGRLVTILFIFERQNETKINDEEDGSNGIDVLKNDPFQYSNQSDEIHFKIAISSGLMDM